MLRSPEQSSSNEVNLPELLDLVRGFDTHTAFTEVQEGTLKWIYARRIAVDPNRQERGNRDDNGQYDEIAAEIRRNPLLLNYLYLKDAEEKARATIRYGVTTIFTLKDHGEQSSTILNQINTLEKEQREIKLALMQQFKVGTMNADQLNRLARLVYEDDPDLAPLLRGDAIDMANPKKHALMPKTPKTIEEKLASWSRYLQNPALNSQHPFIRQKIRELEVAQQELQTPYLADWVQYFHRGYFAIDKEVKALQEQLTTHQTAITKGAAILAKLTQSQGNER